MCGPDQMILQCLSTINIVGMDLKIKKYYLELTSKDDIGRESRFINAKHHSRGSTWSSRFFILVFESQHPLKFWISSMPSVG